MRNLQDWVCCPAFFHFQSTIGTLFSKYIVRKVRSILNWLMTGSDSLDLKKNGDFTAGVVEGFYGMPWSAEQRKILFGWMQKMGLNTYMYAPKDDLKHRAHWRDLYSVEEADSLGNLIECAQEHGVTFVYAVSPGLDIVFSNSKDVLALKRKLEQVATFGCKAFALLFDDIDPELSEADRSVFSSFACAQVSVANEVYQYLGQPKFLFCPTEYCTSRAVPTIQSSGYLSTLGNKLLPGIDILWTGCKVISKKITIKTLEEITAVLRRSPIIWDNIHANDYDPRRVFLGPYDGRSPEIIPYIRGVLSNPNCEFEANYIPVHTLGQWCKSNPDGVKKDIIASERLSPVAADIKLETESDFGSDDDLPCNADQRYRPKKALKIAIIHWIEEFRFARHPPRRHPPPPVTIPPGLTPVVPAEVPLVVSQLPPVVPIRAPADITCGTPDVPTSSSLSTTSPSTELVPMSMPVPDMVKTCTITTLTSVTTTISMAAVSNQMEVSLPTVLPSAPPPQPTCVDAENVLPNPSFLQPLPHPINALGEDCSTNDLDGLSDPGTEVEAMDCVPPSSSSHVNKNASAESLMQVESCGEKSTEVIAHPVTVDDVTLLVNLFYLPFEHGSRAVQFLQALHWLVEHAHYVRPSKKDTPEYKEWQNHAVEFEKSVQATDQLLERIFYSPNKSLLCNLYSYIWDLKSTFAICLAYVKWLEHGLMPDPVPQQGIKATTCRIFKSRLVIK